MNIIGNSCCSSYIVKNYINESFANPFTWCSVTEADIVYVIRHYDDIDWMNFRADLYKNNTFNNYNVYMVIDDKIIIKYPHYILSKTDTMVSGVNVMSKDILKWSTEKYIERVKRMLIAPKPIYVIGGTWDDQKISLSTKHTYANDQHIIIADEPSIVHDNYKLANVIYNKYKGRFKSLLDDPIYSDSNLPKA